MIRSIISLSPRGYCLFLLMWVCVAVQAQDSLSLPQAIELALQNNYSIKIVRNQQKMAENDHTLGNAGFLPQVTATAQLSQAYNARFRQQRQVSQQVKPGTTDTTTVESTQINEFNGRTNTGFNTGITLNWTIFDGMAMFTNHQRLAELEAAGRENAEVTIENTIASVSNAYYAIIQQENRQRAFLDNLRISQARLKLAKNRYEVGIGPRQDYYSAQVDYNADSSAILSQIQQIQNARINLALLLNTTLSPEMVFSDSLVVNPSLDVQGLRMSVEAQNPNLLLAQRNRNIAYLDTKILQAQRLPQVNVFSGLVRNYQNSRAFLFPNLTNSLVFNYGIQASIPIFDGLNQNRRIQNARISQENAAYQYENLKSQVLADVETAYVNYSNSLKIINLERQNLQIARQNVTIALERYKAGVTTSLEVRDVQRNAVAAESRLIDTIYMAKVAETELLRLSSQLVK